MPRPPLPIAIACAFCPLLPASDAVLVLASAELPPARTWRLGVGIEAWRDVPNFTTGQERSTCEAPILSASVSPASDASLDIRVPVWTMQIDDPVHGTGGDFGDITLGATWQVTAPAMRDGFLFGLRGQVTLPQTSEDRGLGPDTTRFQGLVLAGWRQGPWRFDIQTGICIAPEPGRAQDQNDLVPWGLAMQRDWQTVSAFAHALGLAGKHIPGADAHAEARAGLAWTWKRAELAGDIRRGLTTSDGDWGAALTLSFLGGPR